MTSKSPLRAAAATLVTATVVTLGASAASAQSRMDQPMASAWPATQSWTADTETRFGQFVATIGRAVRDRRCHTLASCLNNPAINPLHEAGSRPLRIHADCADVPYVLRAWFAYRNQLPFSYAREMRGHGRDRRYFSNATPNGLRVWTDFSTPRALFNSIGSDVHSGFFRTAPDVENSDFYQAAIAPGAIRPGTTYYDPNGHVLIVYEIQADGEVLMFDGHPDNSVTQSSLTRRHIIGSARQGGGFKNFRPIAFTGNHVVQASNATIRDFGGDRAFDRSAFRVGGRSVAYETFVRSQLSAGSVASAANGGGPGVATTPAPGGASGSSRPGRTSSRGVPAGYTVASAVGITADDRRPAVR